MEEQGLNAGMTAFSGLVESDHSCVVCGYNLRGIALVLYWNMLDLVRKGLKAIRE